MPIAVGMSSLDAPPLDAPPAVSGAFGEAFYRTLVHSMSDGVYFVDRQRRITFWSDGAQRLTGYDAGAVTGHPCHEGLLNHVDADGVQLCHNGCPLLATMGDGQARDAHVWLHHAQGHLRPVHVRAAAIRDTNGAIIGAVETFNDDTAVVSMRGRLKQAQRRALIDPLTGVGNRRLLSLEIASRVARLTELGEGFGLVLLDVDHFKDVNDCFGHDTGDRVIQAVAKTLEAAARRSDVVVRLGGDEFVLVVDAVALDEVRLVAERARLLIEAMRVGSHDQPVAVQVSIGATLAGDGDTAKALLARADRLLYEAKALGRNLVRLA